MDKLKRFADPGNNGDEQPQEVDWDDDSGDPVDCSTGNGEYEGHDE